MTMWSSIDSSLLQFSGQAPLFPLPNLVLFPHSSVPLHIFEHRYRKMTADALAGERLIAMQLQFPSTEASESSTTDHMVGLGRIIAHERLEDGRYMLILKGVSRARLVRELDQDLPYRVAQLELCCDHVPSVPDFDRAIRAEQITSLFCKLFPGVEFQRLVQQAMSEDPPLGSICDVIASALPVTSTVTQVFLDELDTDLRSQMLWQLLKQLEPHVRASTASSRGFPPGFSTN